MTAVAEPLASPVAPSLPLAVSCPACDRAAVWRVGEGEVACSPCLGDVLTDAYDGWDGFAPISVAPLYREAL